MAINNVFKYRMDGGIAGAVNRMHPADIAAQLLDTTNPATLYGQAMTIDATSKGVRRFIAGDTGVTKIYALAARPFPASQMQASSDFAPAAFGNATPPATGVIDVLRAGYMTIQLPSGQTCNKGDAVYVWCAASSGVHVQGGIESGATGGSTAAVTNAIFNGTPDANGNVEIEIWKL